MRTLKLSDTPSERYALAFMALDTRRTMPSAEACPIACSLLLELLSCLVGMGWHLYCFWSNSRQIGTAIECYPLTKAIQNPPQSGKLQQSYALTFCTTLPQVWCFSVYPTPSWAGAGQASAGSPKQPPMLQWLSPARGGRQ